MPLGMGDIDSRDVERGLYAHPPAEIDEAAHEIGARRTMIQAAVDMCGMDRDEAPRVGSLAVTHQYRHRARRRLAMRTVQQGTVDRLEIDHANPSARTASSAAARSSIAVPTDLNKVIAWPSRCGGVRQRPARSPRILSIEKRPLALAWIRSPASWSAPSMVST